MKMLKRGKVGMLHRNICFSYTELSSQSEYFFKNPDIIWSNGWFCFYINRSDFLLGWLMKFVELLTMLPAQHDCSQEPIVHLFFVCVFMCEPEVCVVYRPLERNRNRLSIRFWSPTLASQYMETSYPPSHINKLAATKVQFVAFRP